MAEQQGDSAPQWHVELEQLRSRVEELEATVAALTAETKIPRRQPLARLADALPEPPPAVPSAPSLPAPTLPAPSLEDRLGSQVFNLIGIVALVVGASWFFKLAVEHGWIGPVARVLLGLAVGAGAIVWSESFRRKAMAAFSYSLRAVGSAVLYLVLWAAFQLYHLVPAAAALAAMALATAWNGWMAWAQDVELVAAYALAGGFATPLLLSTGADREAFLFTYLAALDAATVLLVRARGWQRLLLPALLATAAYFAGWYLRFFGRVVEGALNARAWETIAFALVFWALFAWASLRGRTAPAQRGEMIRSVLVPVGNAAFVALALSSVLEPAGQHAWLAWVMAALAAMYLGLLHVQATALARAMHLAIAVVLLSLALPLKASGHTLTTAWLVEGAILFWTSARAVEDRERTRSALRTMSMGAFALGLSALAIRSLQSVDTSFFTANLATALVAVAALGLTLWLSLAHEVNPNHADAGQREARLPATLTCLLALDFIALVLALRDKAELRGALAFWNAGFASALAGLAVLGTVAWLAWRLRTRGITYRQAAGGSLVLFNLVAIVASVQEIEDLFQAPGTTASADRLAQSLAISGFLMAYGAVLLGLGFWRRIAFVRWQALVLLLFTVLKVFLYDMRSLSQGYRVASFLALGAVLLAVSYAYQKDWLGLKQPAQEPSR